MTDHEHGPHEREARGFPPDPGLRARLEATLRVAGLTLGAYDERVIGWLSAEPPSTVQMVCELIIRAYEAGFDRGVEVVTSNAFAAGVETVKDIFGPALVDDDRCDSDDREDGAR